MSHLKMHRSAVRFSSLTAGALLAVFLVGATSANAQIIWSGTINQTLNLLPSGTSSYTMAITEGANTFEWEIHLLSAGEFGTSAVFGPSVQSTGVAATVLAPLTARRFNFESGIGQSDYFSFYPTEGTSNAYLLLHNYSNGQGNFSASSSAPEYAGFSFGGVAGTDFFGWVSFTMEGVNRFRVNDYAYNNGPIGAGMLVPEPSSLALAGLGVTAFAVAARRRCRR